jgi:hypothetical protein
MDAAEIDDPNENEEEDNQIDEPAQNQAEGNDGDDVEAEEEEDDTPSISIKIQNVVATVNLGCRVELVQLYIFLYFSESF